MIFESLDGDTMDRTSHPVYITEETAGVTLRLNAFMDHLWDGVYTSQKRKSTFPFMFNAGLEYTVSFDGSPPKNQRWFFLEDTGQPEDSWTKIRIRYPEQGAFEVLIDGTKVESNEWDE